MHFRYFFPNFVPYYILKQIKAVIKGCFFKYLFPIPMRVKIIMAFFALAFTHNVTVCAQQLARKQINSINYFDEHHLIRKGNEVSVVSIILEWPLRVKNSDVITLQRFLCSNVFNSNSTSLYEAKKGFLNQLGNEIYEMPNENGIKKTYVNIELRMLAWDENYYFSMSLEKSVRDESKLVPDTKETILFTYDLTSNKILTANDILKFDSQKGRFFAPNLTYDIYSLYFIEEDIRIGDAKSMPDQVCIMPKGLLFNLVGLEDEDGKEVLVELPTAGAWQYTKKNVLKLFVPELRKKSKNKGKDNDNVINKEEIYTCDEKVYDVVPNMPKYIGGDKAMMEHIIENAQYPLYDKHLRISGKVVVQFTVKKDGSIADPAVIKPLSPGLDREAVKAIVSMPKWEPGEIDGQKANVKMCVPVVFKID